MPAVQAGQVLLRRELDGALLPGTDASADPKLQSVGLQRMPRDSVSRLPGRREGEVLLRGPVQGLRRRTVPAMQAGKVLLRRELDGALLPDSAADATCADVWCWRLCPVSWKRRILRRQSVLPRHPPEQLSAVSVSV